MLAGLAEPLLAAPVEPTYGHASPEDARSALNREQAANAQRQLAQNAASRQAFEDAQAARDAQIARDQQSYEAEKARLAAEHDAAMAQWRDDVAACRAGDRTRCRHR
jgi:hypothetical protein